jgi:hypothetical protein
MDCQCPDDGILEEIPVSDCPFDLKQIQRLAFATQGKVIWDSATGGGTGTGVPVTTAQVDTLADWQARRTAIDDTKIVVTPLIGGDPVITAGEAITTGGGDNSTLNGVVEVSGASPSTFTAMFKSLTPAQETALKGIGCKATEVYFFTEGGKIVCEKIGATTERKGFNVQAFFLSDRNNTGFGTKDTFSLSFSLAKGWSEKIDLVTPDDFNPLYDI